MAYNDVTKRAIATIDLRKAIGVVDEQKGVARSPASRSSHDYDDSEPYGIGGVSHSFKLEFLGDEIWFYADTDEEKTNWCVSRRLVVVIWAHIGRCAGSTSSRPLLAGSRPILCGRRSCSSGRSRQGMLRSRRRRRRPRVPPHGRYLLFPVTIFSFRPLPPHAHFDSDSFALVFPLPLPLFR